MDEDATRRFGARVLELPENAGVLRYLGQGDDPDAVSVAMPPPEGVDTWRLGAHPDIVEWLWSNLNAALPFDGRGLVGGGAALVDPRSGLILAIAIGTQYAIRLSGDGLAAARQSGYETLHVFRTVGRSLDLATEIGPGWYFGGYDRREGEWLAETCRAANL